jgi:hypothetical protein
MTIGRSFDVVVATFAGRCIGGGTGFMYDGPLARIDGVMQIPRDGMNNLLRGWTAFDVDGDELE